MSETHKMAFVARDKIIKAKERGTETSENEKQQKENAAGHFRIFGTQIRKFLRELREVRGR